MSPILYAALWLLAAFICGSIPFGAIVTRMKGIDIRSIGSGNTGATNVWRALGWKYGISVLLLDALKGFVPVWLLLRDIERFSGPYIRTELIEGDVFTQWFTNSTVENLVAYLPLGAALAAVLGHTFSPWLGFRGGKGVATGLGVIIALYQSWVLIPLAVFGLVLAATQMVSAGSILAALTIPFLGVLAALLAPADKSVAQLQRYWPFGAFVALLVIWTHRSNIKRILDGTENRVGRRKDAQG